MEQVSNIINYDSTSTKNGLIEQQFNLKRTILKNEFSRVNVIALTNVYYDNEIIFSKGSPIRFYSSFNEKLESINGLIEIVLDIRHESTFGRDFKPEKALEFSVALYVNNN